MDEREEVNDVAISVESIHDVELGEQLKLDTPGYISAPTYRSSNCASSSTWTNRSEEMGLHFRTLQPSDRRAIQALHEEWFPVSYEPEFYDDLVKNRMFNSGAPLFSCVAVRSQTQSPPRLTTSDGVIFHFENYNTEDLFCREVCSEPTVAGGPSIVDSSDNIVACVVGSFVDASQVSNHTRDVLLDGNGASARNGSKLFYIMTLGTVTEFRHLGLATLLVEKCIDLVEKDPSCGVLYLHVITFNDAAIRFYEKLGFYRVEEVEDYYTIDEKNYNCYLYAKYFHGNRGHRSIYNLVSSLVSSVWGGVLAPVSLLQEIVVG